MSHLDDSSPQLEAPAQAADGDDAARTADDGASRSHGHGGADPRAASGCPPRIGRCELEDGQALAIEMARRLACDASLVGIVEDEDGEPLSVGRKTRSIPPSLARALSFVSPPSAQRTTSRRPASRPAA